MIPGFGGVFLQNIDLNGVYQYVNYLVFSFNVHCVSTSTITSNDPCTVGHSSKDSASRCAYMCVCVCVFDCVHIQYCMLLCTFVCS